MHVCARRIGSEGARALASALEVNEMLTKLEVSENTEQNTKNR